jgi:N6-L-threonylcarbamoyladenine synthase
MIAQAGYLLAREGFSHGLEMETIPRGRKMPDDMKAPQNILV